MIDQSLPFPDDPTDEAIDRAGRHADADWMLTVANAILRVAQATREFTTDAIWSYLDRYHPQATTHDRRAMGAALRAARADGIIDPTGRYAISTRPVCHRNPKRVWTSLIFEGGST
jgi:hypothetical protein